MKIATEISQLQYNFEVPIAKLQLVDRLGYDVVFASENAGSDIFTPLAYSLACTKRLGVGTSLAVTSARTPACTASPRRSAISTAAGSRPARWADGIATP